MHVSFQTNQQGYGGLGMLFAGLIFATIMYFFFYPSKFNKQPPETESTSTLCRPYVEADGTIKPDAPEIMAPSYTGNIIEPFPRINQDLKPYRLIKANVALPESIVQKAYSPERLRSAPTQQLNCEAYDDKGHKHAHFCQWIHEPLKINSSITKADSYAVLYPAPYTDISGQSQLIGTSSPFDTEITTGETLRYGDHQIIFLVHLDKEKKQSPGLGKEPGKPNGDMWYPVDIYQQVREDDHAKPVNPIPQSVLKCLDETSSKASITFGGVTDLSKHKAEEQLGYFLPTKFSAEASWYYPACKPAVYLYPQKEQLVNVQVQIPKGSLTYTDPLYPKAGWSVLAKPSGQLQSLSPHFADSTGNVNYPTGIFPYLYYEGKVQDAAVAKPEKGYVIAYDKLQSFYDELLPKLGLNEKEAAEFQGYWLKALPKASYYFIGVMPQEQLSTTEPLTITPKEDTLIRVRLFFEALDSFKVVQEPTIITPERQGFTVVDWGGMVKTDKDHPFTCLQ